MGVQSGREGAGGGNAIACTACGLTFFPACPLEGDAMRAALERMRGGGGDFYRRVLGSRAARSQRRQNTAGAQLRRVFAKYCESGGVSGALRGSSGASIKSRTSPASTCFVFCSDFTSTLLVCLASRVPARRRSAGATTARTWFMGAPMEHFLRPIEAPTAQRLRRRLSLRTLMSSRLLPRKSLCVAPSP